MTHDQDTMVKYANDRVQAGLSMPGMFVVLNQQSEMGRTIDNIVLINAFSSTDDWVNQVVFLPW